MTATVRNVMRRTYGAFRSDELTDNRRLKDAMAWLNFRDSVDARTTAAEVFHQFDEHALSGLPNKPARATNDDAYCCGPCSDGVTRYYWVDIVTKDVATKLPLKATNTNQRIFRQSLMRQAEERIRTKRGKVLWLAELKDYQQACPLDLLGDLGRYNLNLGSNDRAIIYTVEIDKTHKPTIVDAGFAFFWLAWKDDTQYGMTLSLRTGLPGYKEWVASKDDIRIVDACFLEPGEGSWSDERIPQAYWDASRKRVLEQRKKTGATA